MHTNQSLTTAFRPLPDWTGKSLVLFPLSVGLALALLKIAAPCPHWSLIPLILTACALIPTLVQHRPLHTLGLHTVNAARSLQLLLLTAIPAFSLIIAIYRFFPPDPGLIPPIPIIPAGQWPAWLLYQLLYVAVAEEIFFRGYLLSHLLSIKTALSDKHPRIWTALAIIISAVLFAAAHWLILANPLTLLTFFPGLIMGWLFVKTRGLLAPIIFHAAANILYALLPIILHP